MSHRGEIALLLRLFFGVLFACAVLSPIALRLPIAVADEAPAIAAAKKDSHGFLIHEVESPYQKGKTQIRVLLPDKLSAGQRYPVVYLLPVEAGNEQRYGDGLVEAKQHDLHNRWAVILVAPTFSHLPWYADHPTDPKIRQESYFMHVVVPFVEKSYPAEAKPAGRLLLGFSKSGWGAWSLLIRHPDTFGRAAAWDAPLMMDRLGKYGTTEIFGNQQTFEKYRLTSQLAEHGQELRDSKRLVLTGYGNFRSEHEQCHAVLDKLKLPHDYRDGPSRKHDWHSGWLKESLELLMADGPSK